MKAYAHLSDASQSVGHKPASRGLRVALMVITVVVMTLGNGLTSYKPAVSQARKDKTRATSTTMREKVYAKISKAAALAEEEQFDEALKELNSAKKIKNLNGYEKAQLYTAFGYMYYSMDDFPRSIEAYETVLVQENLPVALRLSTQYTVAQLQFQIEDYVEAIESLNKWLEVADNPGPEAYILLGQAYYQQEKFREAIPPVEKAMEIAKARDQKVKEKWYLLLRVFYYELQDYPKVLEILEHLVAEYPRTEYWVQIASMYSELGNDTKQLAAYEVAYMQGLLTKGREIVLLSQLLLQAEVPYRAGVVLEKGLSDGKVEKSAKNYRLLSQAWTLAQEDQKAIAALTVAAGMTTDGDLDTWLAYAYSNAGDWEDSLDSARDALKKGVDSPDELHMLMGRALFQLERYEEAKKAFHLAAKSPESATDAGNWLIHIEAEQNRLRELKSSLKK